MSDFSTDFEVAALYIVISLFVAKIIVVLLITAVESQINLLFFSVAIICVTIVCLIFYCCVKVPLRYAADRAAEARKREWKWKEMK